MDRLSGCAWQGASVPRLTLKALTVPFFRGSLISLRAQELTIAGGHRPSQNFRNTRQVMLTMPRRVQREYGSEELSHSAAAPAAPFRPDIVAILAAAPPSLSSLIPSSTEQALAGLLAEHFGMYYI